MNRITANKAKRLTEEAIRRRNELSNIADMLEWMAQNRIAGEKRWAVLQGQSEGLKEAAAYVRKCL